MFDILLIWCFSFLFFLGLDPKLVRADIVSDIKKEVYGKHDSTVSIPGFYQCC